MAPEGSGGTSIYGKLQGEGKVGYDHLNATHKKGPVERASQTFPHLSCPQRKGWGNLGNAR